MDTFIPHYHFLSFLISPFLPLSLFAFTHLPLFISVSLYFSRIFSNSPYPFKPLPVSFCLTLPLIVSPSIYLLPPVAPCLISFTTILISIFNCYSLITGNFDEYFFCFKCLNWFGIMLNKYF